MKKNIKLTEEQRRMVAKNAGKFKNEVLTKITSNIDQSNGGEEDPYIKSTFSRYIGWTKRA